jgi:hypothetical protein
MRNAATVAAVILAGVVMVLIVGTRVIVSRSLGEAPSNRDPGDEVAFHFYHNSQYMTINMKPGASNYLRVKTDQTHGCVYLETTRLKAFPEVYFRSIVPIARRLLCQEQMHLDFPRRNGRKGKASHSSTQCEAKTIAEIPGLSHPVAPQIQSRHKHHG